MKKNNLMILSAFAVLLLTSCNNDVSSSQNKLNSSGNSNNTNNSEISSTNSNPVNEYGVSSTNGQVDLKLGMEMVPDMPSYLLSLSAPFNVDYKTLNGSFLTGSDTSFKLSLTNPTEKNDFLDGSKNDTNTFAGIDNAIKLPTAISSLMGMMGGSSLPTLNLPYTDQMALNFDYIDSLTKDDNPSADIIFSNSKLNYLVREQVNTENEKLLNYAEIDNINIPDKSTISSALSLVGGFISGLGQSNGFDVSLLEGLLGSFDLSSNSIAQAIEILSTGIKGEISGKDNEDGSHTSTINLSLNETGIASANKYLGKLTSNSLSVSDKGINLTADFVKLPSKDVSSFTKVSFDANLIGGMGSFQMPLIVSGAFYLNPNVTNKDKTALDDIDSTLNKASTSYGNFKNVYDSVSEFFGYGVNASFVKGIDSDVTKNIELTEEYGKKINDVISKYNSLDTYTKGLFGKMSFDKENGGENYIGSIYEEGLKVLDETKKAIDAFTDDELGKLGYKYDDSVKIVVLFNTVGVNNFKNWSDNLSTQQQAKLQKGLANIAKSYVSYKDDVTNIAKDVKNYDTFDKLKTLWVDENEKTTFNERLLLNTFYGDSLTSINDTKEKLLVELNKFTDEFKALVSKNDNSIEDLKTAYNVYTKLYGDDTTTSFFKAAFAEDSYIKDIKTKLDTDETVNLALVESLTSGINKAYEGFKLEAQKVNSKETYETLNTKLEDFINSIDGSSIYVASITSDKLKELVKPVSDLKTSLDSIWAE